MDIFIDADDAAVPMTLIAASDANDWVAEQTAPVKTWIEGTGFAGKPGRLTLLPDDDGALGRVVFVVPENASVWDWAKLPNGLAAGSYRVDHAMDPGDAKKLALAWGLEAYAFDRYKTVDEDRNAVVQLIWPGECDRDAVENAVRATALARDLINTPANDMGPGDLADAATALAAEFDAEISVITGRDLLEQNFPAIHAVGRAAGHSESRAPRLIDLTWGNAKNPKVTLVGKGVCFDSGGLDIKGAAGMKLMKKDMGGSAQVLGLARMVMAGGLPVRLRMLVPAVENAISGNAMRPLDIVPTRKGLSIEIGNTDAEGRVILADALHEASEGQPGLIIDFATLTGAARVALGTELPALFCNDNDLAADILAAGEMIDDPLWRMPLWPGYDKMVNGKSADLTNSPEGGYGGSITAALFLQRFVGDGTPWAHIDLMAWNLSSRPGRPEGGEAMGMRAVYMMLKKRFAK